MSDLSSIITAAEKAVRDRSLDGFAARASLAAILTECESLENLRRTSGNLYDRVRALFFLYALHRFHVPGKPGLAQHAHIPFAGYTHLLERRFEEAIRAFNDLQRRDGASETISSALAAAYRGLAFQTLADQVRRSVRSVRGNQWMFRTGHPADCALRIHPALLEKRDGLFPVLREATPVRMDLSHSGWSDIFFLGMDFPEGARVLNISIDLAVRGHGAPRPPVEAFFRVIDQPVLRLVSTDLQAQAEISSLDDVFDFARDYLGLLKAAVIASGLVPPGMEGSDQSLEDLLRRLTGLPGHGMEIVSQVNGIPKGSRLAVSTNLLASLIAACMRATGQVDTLTGPLGEENRRLVAARAILGEWLGGSGGGWQDSGGVWPGIKLIQGELAQNGDAEHGISRGRLLPRHTVFDSAAIPGDVRRRLEQSLVLVHGGMAQDVGPILEMVTERYLLRSPHEWQGRLQAIGLLDEIVANLRQGDIQALGGCTQRNFDGPIQTMIPWAGNHYTEELIRQVRQEFGTSFWGFWMLGGMSGGGMGFLFAPDAKQAAQDRLAAIMSATKQRLEGGVPFAMEPVVYDFAINETGTCARLMEGAAALLPPQYYTLVLPGLVRQEQRSLPSGRRTEMARFGSACHDDPTLAGMASTLIDHLLPQHGGNVEESARELDELLEECGFDRDQHEKVRNELRSGRIGLAQNRLPASSRIEDVRDGDVTDTRAGLPSNYAATGNAALADGAVAIITLAGGAGSRWTHGAGVVKALNPFVRLAGKHRNFVEIHIGKSRRTSRAAGATLPHIFTTSYMTDSAIRRHLNHETNYGYEGPLALSPGRSIGLRLVPMVRDLRFAWEEMPQQILDVQKQKVLESLRASLQNWARTMGEGSDYTDNLPSQCIHPVGHWYEIPNLLRSGVLRDLLSQRPQLRYLLLHNIDTLGAMADPALLGLHIESGAAITTEVIERFVDDRGGGLARVDGRVRLVEGLALPSEAIEFDLTYYNSGTMWIDLDRLLDVFGLSREDLSSPAKVDQAVWRLAARMPTYVTIKDVKKRWGKGQEDVYPVTQFEKLWGDMTMLPELDCRYTAVSRFRGQQLKEVAQLDGWLRDGSAAWVDSLCDWA